VDQAKHKADFGTWLRRTWNAVMRAAGAMDRSPMEDVFDRLDRLEREMAPLKNRKAAGIDDPM
jgi:polyhydroxyalkanoate synthesis regulator phasin